MQAPNVLITHDVQHREAARSNARHVLEELEASPLFLDDPVPGVFAVALGRDPRSILGAARGLCRREPTRFAHTHHWRPVDRWTRADLDAMRDDVAALAPGIGPGDTWRLTAEVHGPSRWHANDLVRPLTDPVRRGMVRMRDPSKVLRVDIFGERAAITLLGRADDLSVDEVLQATMAMPYEW